MGPCGDLMPRLLAGVESSDGASIGLDEHLARWGVLDLRRARGELVGRLEASGLAGHGGAWFPVATKWRSVGNGRLRRAVVVANGAEGEPASAKDALLLARLPHLVLDGASSAAAAWGRGGLSPTSPQTWRPAWKRPWRFAVGMVSTRWRSR